MAKMDLSKLGAKVIESIDGEHECDGLRFDLDMAEAQGAIDRIIAAANELDNALAAAPEDVRLYILNHVWAHPSPMGLEPKGEPCQTK